MNECKLKAFAEQLVEVASHLQHGDAIPATPRSLCFLAGEKQVCLSGPHAETFQELKRRFYDECGWGDKYSEGFVSRLLLTVLSELYGSNTTATAEAALERHVSDYRGYSQRNVVLVPLTGIVLKTPALKLGRVTIVKASESELKRRLGRNIDTNPGQHVFKSLIGRVLAEFETVAEPIRAKEMAVEETRRALEVLRYAIPFIFHVEYKSLGLNVSIDGDLPESDCLSFIVPSEDDSSMTLSFGKNRPAMPLNINEANLAKISECGAIEAAAILEKPIAELTDIERVLLRGIHWFGNALCQGEAESELLSLTTCIETFLTPRDNNPIGTAIAEGIAILLADSLGERKRLKKRVKELYGKRSGVSHGGKKAVLDSDLVELRDIAKCLIKKVITLQTTVNSQKDLLEMIEDAKLSGSEEASTPDGVSCPPYA